jgi:hypothetical protein
MRKSIKCLLATGIVLLLSDPAVAAKLKLPEGMGGVPDIGAIPCDVFSKMLVIGPLGTRLSLLTWADGYYYARTEKTMDELVAAAEKDGEVWDFDRLTDHFVGYCADNPDGITREAVRDLEKELLNKAS